MEKKPYEIGGVSFASDDDTPFTFIFAPEAFIDIAVLHGYDRTAVEAYVASLPVEEEDEDE